MAIIAIIEESEVIRKLQHLNLWKRPQRSPPPRLFPHKLEGLLASLTPPFTTILYPLARPKPLK